MLDPKNINDIVTRLLASIPSGMKNLPEDLANNFKSILRQSLYKMDLVTREEFDAQVKVLTRTREKLEMLQKKLYEWEQQK